MRLLTTSIRVVDQVAFAHDGRQLFAAGSIVPEFRHKPDNRGIDVWDLSSGPNPAARLFADHLIAGFAVNPMGRWLYIGTGFNYPDESTSAYSVVDLTSRESSGMGLSAGNAFVLGMHLTGGWLVAFGHHRTDWKTSRLVRWRQPPAGAPVEEWEVKHPTARIYTRHVACDPNGTRVITHDIEHGPVRDQVYELVMRDAGTGEGLGKIPIPGRTVDQLLFSPDGSRLVIRGGPSLLAWDVRDLARKPRKIRGEGKRHFTGLAFHPTGRYLAAAANDRTVTVYDTTTWQLAQAFAWDIGRMRSVAFSPDGLLIAAGSATGKVVVWDFDMG
jgi:WD40 repeat protein